MGVDLILGKREKLLQKFFPASPNPITLFQKLSFAKGHRLTADALLTLFYNFVPRVRRTLM